MSSREYQDILYRDCIGIMFLYSLLETNKILKLELTSKNDPGIDVAAVQLASL